MPDVIRNVINYCAISCNSGKISVYDKIVIENTIERKYKKSNKFDTNFHLEDGLGMEFTAS